MFQDGTSSSLSPLFRGGRLLALLLALALPVVLTGCGGSGGESNAPGGGSGGEDGDDGGDGSGDGGGDDGGDSGGDGGDDGGGSGGGGGGDDGDDGGDPPPTFDEYAIQYGMNASRPSYAERGIPFADLMTRGSEFGELNGTFIDLTRSVPTIPYGQGLVGEGWPDMSAVTPGTSVGSRLLSGMEGSIPDGRTTPYVLEWTGTGSVRLLGTGVVSETNRTSNRVEVFIDPNGVGSADSSVGMVIDDSSSSDPVRDVHVWLPGMEAQKPLLWQPYVDLVLAMNEGQGPYVWRAMNWAQVNEYGTEGQGSFDFTLASRVTPRSPSQATRMGMCVEYMVAFANEINRDLVLNVPHRTDDMSESDYQIFLDDLFDRAANGSPAVPGVNGGQPFEGLDSDLKLWIELSNEIWNSSFPVYGWMQREASRKNITYEQQVAGEIALMLESAQAAFSGAGDDRLRLYVGGHIVNVDSLEKILDALPTGTQVDAIGTAFYFSEQTSDMNSWLAGYDGSNCPNCPTTEELLDAGRASIPLLIPFAAEQVALADSYVNPDGSTPLVMLYEAGQHFVAGGLPWLDEVNAAQVHPDMYTAYADELVPALVGAGVDVICWFTFLGDQDPAPVGGLGPFGIWNTMDQVITLPVPDIYIDEGAPKAAAIYKAPPKNE